MKLGSLYSLYHYANVYDLLSTFATSIEWEKREGRKIYEKNVKTVCKTAERGKTNSFDS